jgi:hypothetical protein
MKQVLAFVILAVSAASAGYWLAREPAALPASDSIKSAGPIWPNESGVTAPVSNRGGGVAALQHRASGAPLVPASPSSASPQGAAGAQPEPASDEIATPEPARASGHRFTVPLAFLPASADLAGVSLERALEVVPGAFAARPAQSGGVTTGEGRGAVTAAASASKDASSEAAKERDMERLRTEFERTMRQSGLDPESAGYLELWNHAQSVSDRQFAIWYGADAAMKRQAAAYKMAAEQARTASLRP